MSQPQDSAREAEVCVGQKYDPETLKAFVEFVRMSPLLTALLHADDSATVPPTTTD